MDPIFFVLVIAFAVVALLIAARRIRRHFEEARRVRLHAEIASIAEDLSTEPGAISYADLAFVPIEWLEELIIELRKLPEGSRHLRVAWEIVNSEEYEARHR